MSRSRTIKIVLVAALFQFQKAHAQFSPGELSQAHMKLEGVGNCMQCHEVGEKITGAKCLTCHVEIREAIESKHGYHFAVSLKTCVTCHKEHLGRDVQTVLFDRESFDHAATGFALTGEHSLVQCEQCHEVRNIKNSTVRDLVSRTERKTFLGLNTFCVSCHEDRHGGMVGSECGSCHSTTAWSPAPGFDHSTTKFALTGKHTTVLCDRCHAELLSRSSERPLSFSAKNFTDCSPCHKSPHDESFTSQQCKSCHSPHGWGLTPGAVFDHSLTSFKLVGRHATVRCEECHKRAGALSFANAYQIDHSRCTDCHVNYHDGEFLTTYDNDCLQCHTEESFRPSTFGMTEHNTLRFALTGAHAAAPCGDCHKKNVSGRPVFYFSDLRCEACHQDRHAAQFTEVMTEQSCGSCHSTSEWEIRKFDHSRTRFVLTGRHEGTSCEGCHKPELMGSVTVVRYRGIATECESCHVDVHAGQLVSDGATICSACHEPDRWFSLIFDHETQSAFPLAGAHKRVDCRGCHHKEEIDGRKIVRFKPVSTKCESCHERPREIDG